MTRTDVTVSGRTGGRPTDRADVVVVGAGAAGAAFTWRLAAGGLDVLCLEQGHWRHPDQAPHAHPDWETRRLRDHSPSPAVRQRPEDYPIDADDSPIKPLLGNGVGGSTLFWSAHTPRMRPSDFRVHTLDGVGADWPLTYWDLAPYYELNDRMMGVSGRHGDPGNPPRTPRTTPPVPLGSAGARIAAAFDRLGWHWWPSDGNVLTQDVDGRLACNGCGPCELGCPRRSRGSVDITYWPAALGRGARLVTGATVTRVELAAPNRARGVEWVDGGGTARFTAADVVVLAGNGIGTPRLLLASGDGGLPDGGDGHSVANSSGQVGRNLMLHPIAVATGVFPDPVASWAGNDAFALLCQEFYETDPARDFVRGYELQVTRGQGPLVTALGGFTLDVPWGKGHHRRFEQLFGHVASLAVTCEDLPDPVNRVELDPDHCDRFGVPGARLRYRVDGNTERMIDHGLSRAREALAEAGCTEVLESRLLAQAGFHLMGTARMGQDPADSVVDAECRSHDVHNLLVVDGSVFASSAAVNPTPTLQAVALRAADRLLADRSRR